MTTSNLTYKGYQALLIFLYAVDIPLTNTDKIKDTTTFLTSSSKTIEIFISFNFTFKKYLKTPINRLALNMLNDILRSSYPTDPLELYTFCTIRIEFYEGGKMQLMIMGD